MGTMDCLTVKAEAPVSPLFDTDLRWACWIASTLDGRRCEATSAGVGSSLFQNIVSALNPSPVCDVEKEIRGKGAVST